LYQALLADARFHALLLAFDRDLADAARRKRCTLCRGVLHSARYRRKPRGRLCKLSDEHDWRFSYCCAVDGCRTRATPPSLRFFGRKVYLAAMVVLVAIMQHGMSEPRMQRLSEVADVSRRTVARWRRWWHKVFTASPFWQVARAAFMPPVDQDRLPASLLERFSDVGAPPSGSTQPLRCLSDRSHKQLIALLCFIGPLTGGRERAQ
jgi:hypothetical protein